MSKLVGIVFNRCSSDINTTLLGLQTKEAELEERRRQLDEASDSLSKAKHDRQEISSQLEELNKLNSSLASRLRDQVSSLDLS